MTILADTSYIDQINEILQAKRKESGGELAICPKWCPKWFAKNFNFPIK